MHIATSLYERLADELGALIAGRVFAPGERLPSIRHLATQKKLSVSTVVQALRLLEDRGLVEARPQAGYYVRHQPRALMAVASTSSAALTRPAFVGVHNLLTQVITAHAAPGMVPLGSALPPDEFLPNARIRRTMANVSRRQAEAFSNANYFQLNENAFVRQVIRRAADWGRLDAEQIVVTGSCTEAIHLCLRAVAEPGDTIAVESSTFFVLLNLLESLGLKALEIPTDPVTGASLDALELAMREGMVKACLLIPNCNNPTGSIMPDASKQRLAQLASLHDIPVIEDDIYGDLCFTPQRPWPVKAWDTSGHVMLCSSFSKTISPAVRVGVVVAGKYARRIQFLKTVSSGVTSHLFQAAVAEFINGSAYEVQLRKMRRVLAQRIARMSDAVAAAFPAECRLSRPQGGFTLWVQMPPQTDALALHASAIAERIAFMPGQIFSASGQLQNYLRLNCGHGWSHAVDNAVMRLGSLVQAQLAAPAPALRARANG
jgi:DNA-binding transcriptional MocR family regulator